MVKSKMRGRVASRAFSGDLLPVQRVSHASSNGKLRDELLNMEMFATLVEAKVWI